MMSRRPCNTAFLRIVALLVYTALLTSAFRSSRDIQSGRRKAQFSIAPTSKETTSLRRQTTSVNLFRRASSAKKDRDKTDGVSIETSQNRPSWIRRPLRSLLTRCRLWAVAMTFVTASVRGHDPVHAANTIQAANPVMVLANQQAEVTSSLSSLSSAGLTHMPYTRTTTTPATIPSVAKKGMLRVASIMDLANVLDHKDVPKLTKAIEQAQQKTQTEIQILIVNQVQKGYTPKRMATTLFNQWRLGTAKKNNGVLILVVVDDRRTEIEVGKTLDSAMNAQWCQSILQENASPAFRQEQYGKGLLATVRKISQKLVEVDSGLYTRTSKSSAFHLDGKGIGWFVIVVFAFVSSAYDARYPIKVKCPSCGADKDTWEYSGMMWETTLVATDEREGAEELRGTRANCGYVYIETRAIRRYDGSTTDGDGNISYYYDDDSSDSGGSSDGGGGGDSW